MLTTFIPFSITINDGQIIPVRDIFLFRNFMNELFADNSFKIRYNIKSGDTPASIAYYVYGSERYEWIIYCMNNIINPYYEWPLSENDFYDMIESKYLNKKCLFLEMDSFTNNFSKNEAITSGSATGIVDSWDRTLCKITISNVTGEFEVGDNVTSSGSSGTIARIIDKAEDALHHFETSNGVPLDPYVGYLQSYLNSSSDLYAVTNKQYEEKINDSKRAIYVLKPDFVRTAENYLVKNLNKLSAFESENIFR
jgi:hypothetical protein